MRSMRLLPKMLLLLFIPVAFTICGMVYTAYVQAREAMVTQVKAELVRVAQLQRDDLENIFTIFKSITVNASKSNQITGFLGVFKSGNAEGSMLLSSGAINICTQMVKDFPRITVMGVLDTQGIVRAHSTEASMGAKFGEREYFKEVMRTGAPTSSIVISHTTGTMTTVIAAPVKSPDKPDEVLGVVFVGIGMQTLADGTVNKLKIGKRGVAFCMDKKGIDILDLKKFMGEDLSTMDWARAILSGSGGLLEYVWQDEDKIAAYEKIPFVDYTVVVSVVASEVLEPVVALRQSLVLLGLGGLVLLGVVIFLVVRSLTKPLGIMAGTAQKVAEGDWSVDPMVQAHIFVNKGEVETVYRAFSQMLLTLKEKICYYESILDAITSPLSITDMDMRWVFINKSAEKLINNNRSQLIGKRCSNWKSNICNTEQCGIACLRKGQARSIFDTGDQRFEVHTSYITNLAGQKVGHVEVVSDITDVTQAREEAVNALHEGMLAAAAQLEGVVGIVSSASTQLAAQLEQSERGAVEQATRVAETATAMEEMNATVLEVARNAGQAADVSLATRKEAESGADVVQKAVNSIQIVQQQAQQLKQDMFKLDENAQAISQIMAVISDIADQTNLLALNAAIEAARAGEAGRGFAVVADEVRKLAEKTMASTADVSKAVSAIQSSTAKSMAQVDASAGAVEEATRFANLSGEALKKIVDMVDNSAEQVRGIATASEQQSSTSEGINRALGHVNDIASDTARVMQEASRAVADMSGQAQTLTQLIDSMKRR